MRLILIPVSGWHFDL